MYVCHWLSPVYIVNTPCSVQSASVPLSRSVCPSPSFSGLCWLFCKLPLGSRNCFAHMEQRARSILSYCRCGNRKAQLPASGQDKLRGIIYTTESPWVIRLLYMGLCLFLSSYYDSFSSLFCFLYSLLDSPGALSYKVTSLTHVFLLHMLLLKPGLRHSIQEPNPRESIYLDCISGRIIVGKGTIYILKVLDSALTSNEASASRKWNKGINYIMSILFGWRRHNECSILYMNITVSQ